MDALRQYLVAERDRRILWVPVIFAMGIGCYFGLRWEPHWATGPAAMLASALVFAFFRRASNWPFGPLVAFLAAMICVGAAGVSAAQWRTITVDTAMLSKKPGPGVLSGRIVQVETFPDSSRLTLERPVISRLSRHATPDRVRVRLRGKQPNFHPGDWIEVRANLSPPPPPATFDFQRHSYFQGIGAVGFALGPARVTGGNVALGGFQPGIAVARIRTAVTEQIKAALPGRLGGVAAALMTGERSAVPADVLNAMHDSGLAHLLAISGLHIGLVAGILFTVVRAVLALVAPIALRFSIKKWAAVTAMIAAFAYAVMAGATLPTQRAFLMIALALIGVLLDRRGLSLRSVAWAAMVILVIQPESVLGASFQMSFAAVIALIAGYEYLSERRAYGDGDGWNRHSGWWQPSLRYLAGIAITTLIAGAATAPFAVFHFNRFADYGLIANLIAVPLTGLWVMPSAMLAFLLMPFGAEAWALAPMGWGLELVIQSAKAVAAWPGAVTLMPAMPVWGLVLISLGGLWLCLWRRVWRLWGLAVIAAGFSAMIWVEPPQILIDGAGRVLAIKADDGRMLVSQRRRGRFQQEIWARLSGLEHRPGIRTQCRRQTEL